MPFDAAQGPMNLTPVKPLIELHEGPRSYEHSSLHQLIREMHLEVKEYNRQERIEAAETGRLMSNLRQGKVWMKRDPIYGRLTLLPPLPQRPRKQHHQYPLAQTNSSQLTSIWTLSRPKSVVRHFGNTNRAQIQHAIVQQVADHYNNATMDEAFHQRWSLSKMDYGTSAIRIFYDAKLNALTQLKPVIENTRKTTFEGYGFCRNCGFEGTDADFPPGPGQMPACRECGNTNVSDLVPAQVADVAEIVGVEELAQGDISVELLPIPALNWDMRVLVHESSFVTYDSEVPTRVVEGILGVEMQDMDPSSDDFLSIINEIGSPGGAAEGWGRENFYGNHTQRRGRTVMHEDFFLPEWYTGCKLSADEETLSGETIPAGVPLEQIFPDCMAVCGFNDMDVLFHVANEKPRIIGGVYHIQSFSGRGKGTTDAIEIAEDLSKAHSAAMEVIKREGAGGGYWYDKETLTAKEAQALLKPGALVGVKMRGTQYKSVNDVLQKVQTGEVNQSNLAMIAQLANMLNISFQTTDFTSGVADSRVDVNTATGQQMLAAQNQQRSAAPLRMKGYQTALITEEVVALFRERIQIPVFFGTSDKFSLTKGRNISGKELPARVKFDFVPDSEQPTNLFVKRQNAEQMLEKSQHFGVPFAQLVEANPRIASWWASLFQTDLPILNYQEMLMVCQDRIDDIDTLCEAAEEIVMLSGFEPPIELAVKGIIAELANTVKTDEENHIVKAQILGEYLDDDEVKEWSPLKLAAVNELIAEHYRQQAMFMLRPALLQQEAQITLQAKAAQAQQALAQPAIDAERGAAREDAALQFAADQLAKEEDHSRAMEAQEATDRQSREGEGRQLDRDLLLRQVDHTNTTELEDRRARAAANGAKT